MTDIMWSYHHHEVLGTCSGASVRSMRVTSTLSGQAMILMKSVSKDSQTRDNYVEKIVHKSTKPVYGNHKSLTCSAECMMSW